MGQKGGGVLRDSRERAISDSRCYRFARRDFARKKSFPGSRVPRNGSKTNTLGYEEGLSVPRVRIKTVAEGLAWKLVRNTVSGSE